MKSNDIEQRKELARKLRDKLLPIHALQDILVEEHNKKYDNAIEKSPIESDFTWYIPNVKKDYQQRVEYYNWAIPLILTVDTELARNIAKDTKKFEDLGKKVIQHLETLEKKPTPENWKEFGPINEEYKKVKNRLGETFRDYFNRYLKNSL